MGPCVLVRAPANSSCPKAPEGDHYTETRTTLGHGGGWVGGCVCMCVCVVGGGGGGGGGSREEQAILP